MRKILLCMVSVVFCAALLLSGCAKQSGPTGKSLGQGYGLINTADDPDFHPEKSAVEEPSEKAEEPALSTFMQNSPFGEDGAVILDIDEQYASDAQGWAIACSNGRYGWLDSQGNVAVNFVFEEAYDFDDQDMALVKKDGYYGWIDRVGNIVIPFQFEDAYFFNGDSAIVQPKNVGVIDRTGTYLIDPIYHEIVDHGNYFTVKLSGKYGAYDTSGNLVVPVAYREIVFQDDRYYAEGDWGYPYNWVPFSAAGEDILDEKYGNQVTGITLPKNGGVIARGRYGDLYLLNMDLDLLVDALFEEAYEFSSAGYAVAEHASYPRESLVFDLNGDLRYIVPNSSGWDNPRYANEYYAAGPRYIVNLKTDERFDWGSVTPVDGTNYIIVKDDDSELYGLYDGLELVKNGYTEITAKGTSIYLRLGGSETQYVPSGDGLSDSAAS